MCTIYERQDKIKRQSYITLVLCLANTKHATSCIISKCWNGAVHKSDVFVVVNFASRCVCVNKLSWIKCNIATSTCCLLPSSNYTLHDINAIPKYNYKCELNLRVYFNYSVVCLFVEINTLFIKNAKISNSWDFKYILNF